MKISQIIHWFLRMFVYACMGTSAILLLYDFENNCLGSSSCKGKWFAPGIQFIYSMNGGQEAYYAENGNFSNSIDNLGLGMKTDISNYNFRILSPMNPVQNVEELKPSPLDDSRTIAFATSQKAYLKSYMGIVWTLPNDDYTTTTSVVCQRKKEQILYPSILPEISDNQISCPPGFEVLE